MTTLDRFARHLALVLQERSPEGVHRPVSIRDLRTVIMPYRFHRNPLGLSCSEDYELLLLRLCAEESGYVRTFPPAAAERCRAEVATPNPYLGLIGELDEVTIQIGAASLTRLLELEDTPAQRSPLDSLPLIDDTPAGSASPRTPANPAPEAPPVRPIRLVRDDEVPAPDVGPSAVPDRPPATVPPRRASGPERVVDPGPEPATHRCGFCLEPLPSGRPVAFCPFCGERVGPLRCSRCGTELEAGWRHCITCGFAITGDGANV